MARTAIYMRLSLEDGDGRESNSITNQRILLRDYVSQVMKIPEYDIVEYCDDGYSGTNFERPGVQRLLEDVKGQKIKNIVVKDFSRFSRDYIEIGTYLNQIFPFIGVRFIAVNDHYDSESHKGATMELEQAFKTMVNDFYSKNISIQEKKSKEHKCANGEYVCGNPPLGYRKSPDCKNQVIIDEEEAAVVQRIFEAAAKGESANEIVKWLYKDHIPTWKARRRPQLVIPERIAVWNQGTIRKILSNRFYIGEYAYHKSVVEEVGSNKCVPLPENQWKIIKNHHPPIISDELFQAAQYRKSDRSTKRKFPKHPLVGKLYCGGCGYAMSYKREIQRKEYRRFECRRHAQLQIPDCCTIFKASVLEELVLYMISKELLKLVDIEDAKRTMAVNLRKEMDLLKHDLQENYRIRKEWEIKKRDAYEKYSLKKQSIEEYQERKEMCEAEIMKLEEERKEGERRLRKLEERNAANEYDLRKFFGHVDITELTEELVDTFIQRIYVYKDRRVEIVWNYQFPELVSQGEQTL